jgi:hypothetical protein
MNINEVEKTRVFIMEKYIPHKTPNTVIDNLEEIITNKSFFEIGSGWGHTLNYIKCKYNIPKIGGLEYRKEQVEYYTKKYGIKNIIYKNIFDVDKLPKYDVYYIWSTFSVDNYMSIIDKINNGVILISFFIESPKCDKKKCKGCGIQSKAINILKNLGVHFPSAQIIETKYYSKDEYSIHTCRTSGTFKTLVIKKNIG